MGHDWTKKPSFKFEWKPEGQVYSTTAANLIKPVPTGRLEVSQQIWERIERVKILLKGA